MATSSMVMGWLLYVIPSPMSFPNNAPAEVFVGISITKKAPDEPEANAIGVVKDTSTGFLVSPEPGMYPFADIDVKDCG